MKRKSTIKSNLPVEPALEASGELCFAGKVPAEDIQPTLDDSLKWILHWEGGWIQ